MMVRVMHILRSLLQKAPFQNLVYYCIMFSPRDIVEISANIQFLENLNENTVLPLEITSPAAQFHSGVMHHFLSQLKKPDCLIFINQEDQEDMAFI